MLDDVLSAVDAQVARWILHNAILGPFMDQKTRILCTHNVQVDVFFGYPHVYLRPKLSQTLSRIYWLIESKDLSQQCQSWKNSSIFILKEFCDIFENECKVCFQLSQAISSADMVVVMDKGQVTWVGSSVDLAVSSYPAFSPQNEFDALSDVQGKELSMADSIQVSHSHLPERESNHVSEEVQEIVEAESRKEGRVELAVYK